MALRGDGAAVLYSVDSGSCMLPLANKPVFFDATGRRAARISTVGWVAAVFSTILFIGFVTSLVITGPPPMSICRDGPCRESARNWSTRRSRRPVKSAARLATEARNRRLEIARLRRLRSELPSRVLPAILKPQTGPFAGHRLLCQLGCNRATPALIRSNAICKQLDWVMPSWLTLDGPDLNFKITLDRRSLNYMRANKPGVAILPVLQNVTADKWNGPGLAKLLADPARRPALQNEIVDFLAANKLQGVTIDFEEVPPAAHHGSGNVSRRAVRRRSRRMAGSSCRPRRSTTTTGPTQAYANIVDYTLADGL